MNDPESLFYFAIKHQPNLDDNICHKKYSLGKDEVKLILKTAQNNGLKRRLTSYSVRKMYIKGLSIQTYLYSISKKERLLN